MHLLSQADKPDAPVTLPPTTYRDVDDTRVSDPSAAPLIHYDTEADIEPCNRHVRRTRPLRSRLPHPRLSPLSRRHTHPHLHSHLPAVPTSLGDQSESEDTDDVDTTEGDSEDTIALRSEQIDTGFSTEPEDQTPAPLPSSSEPAPRWDQPARPSRFMRLLKTLTSLSPPLVASLFALFCVLVPPVQRVLKSDEMIPFKGALDSAGACSVPVTLLVLGGWFWDGDATSKNPHTRAKDEAKGSDGQGNAKNKGKRAEKQGAPRHLVSPSRDSSTTSLSSMIGAIGDVLMARIHPRSRRREGTAGDVEPGLLATHVETEIEHAENGRVSRSRSRTGRINGHVWPSPISSSSSPSLHPAPTPRTSPNSTGETLTVFVTLFARMVLVPLICTPMMVVISRLGWGGEVFEEYVRIFISLVCKRRSRASSQPSIHRIQHVAHRKSAGADPRSGAHLLFSHIPACALTIHRSRNAPKQPPANPHPQIQTRFLPLSASSREPCFGRTSS